MAVQYETKISKSNLEAIRGQHMTPAEIIAFLEAGALYRSFADVLRAVYPGEDLAERLRSQLAVQAGGALTAKETDAIRKNVANWLKGESVPQNREQLFRIAFALGLDEAAASRILSSASDTGLHYRNPRELIYAFSLRTGLSYRQAQALQQELEPVYGPVVEAAEAERQAQWKTREQAYRERRAEARRLRQARERQGLWAETYQGLEELPPPNFFTQRVYRRFEQVNDQEALRRFFLECAPDLGYLHESAYEKFWRLMRTLQEPDDAILPTGEEEVYPLDRVAEEYFRMHVPLGKNTSRFDYLQKAIKKNWPGATELQKMKSRKIDVSRKAMLLLFLITEDFLFSEDLQFSDRADEAAAWFLPEEDESPRDQLEVVLSKINLFLETYGMNQLDPGTPFDCLVIYALASAYEGEFLSEKFSLALAALFPSAQGEN